MMHKYDGIGFNVKKQAETHNFNSLRRCSELISYCLYAKTRAWPAGDAAKRRATARAKHARQALHRAAVYPYVPLDNRVTPQQQAEADPRLQHPPPPYASTPFLNPPTKSTLPSTKMQSTCRNPMPTSQLQSKPKHLPTQHRTKENPKNPAPFPRPHTQYPPYAFTPYLKPSTLASPTFFFCILCFCQDV